MNVHAGHARGQPLVLQAESADYELITSPLAPPLRGGRVPINRALSGPFLGKLLLPLLRHHGTATG